MVTTPSQVSPLSPSATLLDDYDRWLAFLKMARRTTRRYDQQLAQISHDFPHLSFLSNYLRNCMGHRIRFFGRMTTMLTSTANQLRTDAGNETLYQRLKQAHPVVQAMIVEMTDAFNDIEASYQNLSVSCDVCIHHNHH